MRAREEAHDSRKYKRHDKVSESDKKCEQRQPSSAGHAHACNEPDGGSGRKPLHLVYPHKDEAGADEAYAGNNLRSNTRRVKNNTSVSKNIREAVLRDQQKKGRRVPTIV